MDIETHPFQPFLPARTQLLMLGSFPPQPKRWCMDFYYPNRNNDMWRIIGLLFFGDKNRFIRPDTQLFDKESIVDFLNQTGIALYDTATAVRRLQDNASDKFLEVVQPTDIPELLRRIPLCKAIVTTGEKATDTLCQTLQAPKPAIGCYTRVTVEGKEMRIYRMPSTSRAYPLALEKKAAAYRPLFTDLGLIND